MHWLNNNNQPIKRMEFDSKLFCFLATMLMFVIVVIVELTEQVPMIGYQSNQINKKYDENSIGDEYEFKENSFGTFGSANLLHNRQQALLIMIDLDTRCKRLIESNEKQCFRKYFERYGKLDEQVFTEDIKSDFNRRACCYMWQWYDCTRTLIQQECDEINLRKFETKLVHSYVYNVYCVNYEYGSDACAPITVWMVIGFATLGIMILAGTCLAVLMVVRHLRLKHEERKRRAGQSYDDVPGQFEL